MMGNVCARVLPKKRQFFLVHDDTPLVVRPNASIVSGQLDLILQACPMRKKENVCLLCIEDKEVAMISTGGEDGSAGPVGDDSDSAGREDHSPAERPPEELDSWRSDNSENDYDK